jgi:ER degradation enhancer, mannosidase alpha-like 2
VTHLYRSIIVLLLLCSVPAITPAQTLADSVKAEFLHAWQGYSKYAYGHDDLRPLSKQPHDWYGHSLAMTPVDAYDCMLLMGLDKEAAKLKWVILDTLRTFDLNIDVQLFEVNIRVLGGLLSAYQLDGDKRFLTCAERLGQRLLPAFKSPTGMPYRYVNLRTGKTRDSLNNPAEIGTTLLEFGELSKFTDEPIYYQTAKKAVSELYKRRSDIGLVGTSINVETGRWVDTISHIGGMIDSYYEYLLKAWYLFGDNDCREMWNTHAQAIMSLLADTVNGRLWFGQADMNTGKKTGTRFGSLEAFFPALLCLAGDTAHAAALEESCAAMWDIAGIEPEEIDYSTMKITAKQYLLRPEIIESAYYLYQTTGNPKWKELGARFFRDIVRYCRTDEAYAMLDDVTTKHKADRMESFFFAETLKYCYLLFSPPTMLRFDRTIFNTEAHPFSRPGR